MKKFSNRRKSQINKLVRNLALRVNGQLAPFKWETFQEVKFRPMEDSNMGVSKKLEGDQDAETIGNVTLNSQECEKMTTHAQNDHSCTK